MADEKEVIIRVSADTSDATASTQDLKDKLDEVNDTPIDKPFKSFRAEIKEAINTAKQMEEQFGRNSKQFVDASKNVALLKKNFKEFGETVQAFNPENKLQALVQVAKGATGALAGVTGAMAFLGVESGKATETIAKLQGLMAFSQALNSIDDIKNGFQSFKLVVVDAFNTLKASIGSTGIGLLVIAVGFLVEKFIAWKNSADSANIASKGLEDTTKDYAKAAAGAAQKVDEVRAAFDLAKEGVVSKHDALKKYNDTLGDTFGKTNDLNTAERLLAEKADVYIKVTGLKAQANALFALSAEQTSKALLAKEDDQTGTFDKAKEGVLAYFGAYTTAADDAIDAQTKGIDAAQKKFNAGAADLKTEGEKILKEAAELAKTGKINANILDNKDDKKDKKDNSDAEKFKHQQEELAKNRKELQAIIDKSYQDAEKARATAQQKELLDAQDHAIDMKTKVADNIASDKKILDEELKNKSISRAEYNKQIAANQQQALSADLAIETEKLNQVIAINKKYYDEDLKAQKEAEDKKAEAAFKIQEKQTNDLIGNIKSEADSKTVSLADKKKFIDDERDYVLRTTQYTADEKTKILAALSDAEKKIDADKLAAKKANIDLETGLLDAASEIAGKNTVAGKALAIASATISTYEAAQGAYKSQMSIPSVDAPLRAAAAAALAVLQGLARVKAIVAVKVPTKSGGTGTGTSAPPALSAPQINATLLQPDANAIKDVRVINQQDQVVKAYISQNDLQANQDRTTFLNNLGKI